MDDVDAARKEAEAMQLCGTHPNLVSLLGTFDVRRGAALSLVLELVEGPGDLHTCVVERGPFSLDATKHICGEIGSALKHVHSKNLVYGDVKPENVLITSQGHVKLCDFGSTFSLNDSKMSKIVGTVEYMPPEQSSSIQGDWWAFGCTLHFVITGRPPVFFDTENEVDLATAFSRAVTFADQQGGTFIKDTNARQLVASLCSKSPNQRPSDGGESHVFFSGYQPWNDLHKRTNIPAIPAAKGAANASGRNPWQRRTFSTIHSPMPRAYITDEKFISECLGNIGPTIQTLELPPNWSSTGSSVLTDLDTAIHMIPKHRVAAPVSDTNRGNSASGAKKMRRTPGNYVVAGVDLTAG
jgi:serine/threonine protein kinase